MTDPSDPTELEARLELVHEELLELRTRVAALESSLRGASSPAPVEVVPEAAAIPVIPWLEPPTVASEDPTPTFGTRLDSPIKVLALTGGVALLLGLAFFVVYAIEQHWISPSVRFGLAAFASALLTVAAWPIARRGYEQVAGAIGGAGLGGWFAAWLVALHVHSLVSVPLTFGALVIGAAACLLIADRLRLRLMAGLASAAACATPPLVMSGDSGIHGLMLYQLLVIAGLLALDARRRWPELPTIGLVATWVLAGSWAVSNLPASNHAVLAWALVLLAVSAGSGWRLVRDRRGLDELVSTGEVHQEVHREVHRENAIHVFARLVVAGIATWAFAGATLEFDTVGFAIATALLCVWHLGLAIATRTRASQASALFLLFAWVQALMFGPIRMEDAGLMSWWIALALVLTAVPWAGLERVRRPLLTITALLAVLGCLVANETWSLPLGLLGSTVLLAASVWPYPRDVKPRPIIWLGILTTFAWSAVVAVLGPDAPVPQLALGLIPGALLLGFACWRPSFEAQLVAAAQLGLGLGGALVVAIDVQALSLTGTSHTGAALGMAFILLVFAGLGAATVAFLRETTSVTGLGLLSAPVLLLAGLLAVAGVADGSPALGQVGYSLTTAGVGLVLIVAGLRMNDPHWRQVGLAAIAVAAGKVVLIDLDTAAVGWRALSFVGLGAILIGGAFAYSRAARRAAT